MILQSQHTMTFQTLPHYVHLYEKLVSSVIALSALNYQFPLQDQVEWNSKYFNYSKMQKYTILSLSTISVC